MRRLSCGGRDRLSQASTSIGMFVLIWATLLFSVRGSNNDTGASVREHCQYGFCITLTEGEITAEAGLCVVIPCSFTTNYGFTPQHMIWYKCAPFKERCGDSDVIFHTNKNKRKVQPGFIGRVSLLESDPSQKNCSIIINDLTESDSGSYQLRVNGFWFGRVEGFTFISRATVSVKDLSQKPTVIIHPLTEGQQTTLTCTAPGLCSGSVPTITWTWRGTGENNIQITGNTMTETLTAVTQRHSSTLTFNSSTKHHGTNVTCKVGFTGDITTEEVVTLNLTCPVQHCRPDSAVFPWAVAGVSLSVNVFSIIYVMFLWNARKKVKPNEAERTYMSLRKTDQTAEYDVIAHPLK